jgi:hypothetical protein
VRFRHVALASTTVALTACSLFSGWGGLEGAASRDGGSGGSGSSSGGTDGWSPTVDGGNASDAVAAPDHLDATAPEAGPATVACGSTSCDIATGQGCCIQGGASGTCTQSTVCATSGFFLACDSSSQCMNGQVCCFNVGTSNGSQCESLCSGATASILCSPQVQGDCPSPKQCLSTALPPGYHSCQ